MKVSLKTVLAKKQIQSKGLTLNIETENDESEWKTGFGAQTETGTETESEAEAESFYHFKQKGEEQNDDDIKFIRKIPTHPRNHLKRNLNKLTFKYYQYFCRCLH